MSSSSSRSPSDGEKASMESSLQSRPGSLNRRLPAHATSTVSAPVFSEAEDAHSRDTVPYDLNVNIPTSPKSAPDIATFASPTGIRRRGRANTFKTLEEFEEFESRPGWRPGTEPGIDPKKPDGGQGGGDLDLHAECQITVVDFSQADLEIHELDNGQLIDFVKQPQPDWVKCRWINVNGLSWDVIKALGEYKDLHRLAIEDIMNTRNRTKADWYPGHAFLILTCLKLVCLLDENNSDSSDDEDHDELVDHSVVRVAGKRFRRWITGKKAQHPTAADVLEKGTSSSPPNYGFSHQATTTSLSDLFNPNTLRTLQRYHAAPNTARTEYMERHSALVAKGLAVSAEQVSMFITSDNTVIAFFEQSADNIEEPILARLRSPTTILRKSCDASMVAQAIIDAIIDMAIPVTACYADIVGDLELDVLTHPSIKHTKSLYIIISEINKMFSLVNPIQTLISSLRDHKTKLSQEAVSRELQNPMGGVIITPVTYTYLGDVYDHCVLITENLTQIKESANHMIDLIFNTIATYQNESMKQLTIVTIIFLPLTFITGYFGQNFEDFPEAKENSSVYFWKIATPVAIGTVLILMRDIIYQSLIAFFQRRRIIGLRKRKKRKMDQARRMEKLRLPSHLGRADK